MEYIGIVAGKSGDAIVKEIHKWDKGSVLICGKENERGVDLANKTFICDLSDKEKICNYFKKQAVSKVIFGTGHILAIELADFLCKKGFLINIIPEVSKLCNNKYALKKEVKKIGLLTPDFLEIVGEEKLIDDVDNVIQDIGLPCVVKSIKDIVPPKLVWEKRELIEMGKTLLKNEPSIMVEEYISGTDCTAVVLNENGNAKCIFTMPWNKAEEDELEGFEKILPNEDLTECPINLIKQVVEKLINHVNVLGVSRVDFIVKDFKIFILEINSLVFSGNLEGSQYTINNYRNGINLSKHIVSSAMKMFFKQKELSRMNETIEFIPQSNRLIGIENQVRMDKKYAIVSKDSIELVLLSDGQKAIYSPEMIESIYRYHGNFYLKLLFEQYLLDRQSNNLDEGDIRMVVLFMGVIIAQNADFYKNSLDGHLKELLDIALEFLNKNDKH